MLRKNNVKLTNAPHKWQVEELGGDVEVKSRRSKPDLNSVHLSFPQHMRQLPVASVRQKGGGVPWKAAVGAKGGAVSKKLDKSESRKPLDKLPTKSEPHLVRVTLDGGRESEEELCTHIKQAAEDFSERRELLQSRLGVLLHLRRTPFDITNPLHPQQLTRLWHLVMGQTSSAPPTNNMPSCASWSCEHAVPADWGDLGFQNRFCPQSDFRDMGMLSGALYVYGGVGNTRSGSWAYHPLSARVSVCLGCLVRCCLLRDV